jgi:hypothetical protein
VPERAQSQREGVVAQASAAEKAARPRRQE